MRVSSKRLLAVVGVGLVLGIAGCTPGATGSLIDRAAPRAVDVAERAALQRPSFSDEDEARMAQENARTFEATHQIWNDMLLDQYLSGIVQRLVAVAEPAPFVYRVRVVADARVNAFTFGGGLIYVHAGLVARMENEAQLAMILAREVAHVSERHVRSGIERTFSTELLGDVAMLGAQTGLAVAGVRNRTVNLALNKTYEYTLNAMINGHGRAQEHRADELALEYLLKAGYDPREAPEAYRQLLAEYGDSAPLQNFFYENKPGNLERVDRLGKLIRTRYAERLEDAQLLVNTEEFKRRTREVVVLAGTRDYEGHRYGTATAMFEKALRARGQDPVPHHYLGKIVLETLGDAELERAVAHLTDAITVDPGYAPAYLDLGLAHYRMGDAPGAVAAFDRYLELDPRAEDAGRIRQSIADLRRE